MKSDARTICTLLTNEALV